MLEGVRARLVAEAGWTALVTGGTWAFRRPQQAGWPYCVLTVEEREPDYVQSDGKYLQTFVVEVSVWAKSGDDAAADTAAPAALLQSALGWIPGDPANGLTVPHAVRVVHVKPAGGKLALTDELKQGQDVMAAGRRVEVTIEGSR